jgi:hypothetical protein
VPQLRFALVATGAGFAADERGGRSGIRRKTNRRKPGGNNSKDRPPANTNAAATDAAMKTVLRETSLRTAPRWLTPSPLISGGLAADGRDTRFFLRFRWERVTTTVPSE